MLLTELYVISGFAKKYFPIFVAVALISTTPDTSYSTPDTFFTVRLDIDSDGVPLILGVPVIFS